MVHGPQVDLNDQDFRPPGDIPPFGFGNGDFNGFPPGQNFFGSRPGRQSVVLPPSEDYPDDVFIFDRPTSQRPTRPPTTLSTTTPTTTTSRPVANCDCPSTPEFNPVCGTDSQTYNNPSKLKCAVFCGTGKLNNHVNYFLLHLVV
ncbi:hypothetical protein C0J52_24696 [Blattella germanica]|nr:hypothetical protein C0J52_24696 [Blattella germanica]